MAAPYLMPLGNCSDGTMLPPVASGSVSVNSVRDRVQAGLRVAMKAGDKASVKAFRSALSAIANSEAVDAADGPARVAGPIAGSVRGLGAGDVPRVALTELDMLGIVEGEIASLAASAAQYDALGETTAADDIRAQILALQRVLADA
jgi:hypothetical protein